MTRMHVNLEKLLHDTKFANGKLAPVLKLFDQSLESVLNETQFMKPTDAMKKLLVAKGGAAQLVSDFGKQQEDLMREDSEQRESLLMGVLVAHKQAPMSEQMEYLRSNEFIGLDVAKALMEFHDESIPLFEQVAKYLDLHKHAGGSPNKNNVVHDRDFLANSLDKRVKDLERDMEHRAAVQRESIEHVNELVKTVNNQARAVIRQKQRMYEKDMSQSKHDIALLKEAAASIRRGDVKTARRVGDALKKSLEALKSSRGSMIYFLQKSSVVLEKDCPYCVAQCLEACHNEDKSYIQCLAKCDGIGAQ